MLDTGFWRKSKGFAAVANVIVPLTGGVFMGLIAAATHQVSAYMLPAATVDHLADNFRVLSPAIRPAFSLLV